jgi:hypothetical protein
MNIDKAKKRIAKQIGKGFKGFPMISIAYFGETPDLATKVVMQLTMEEGDIPHHQEFTSRSDVREDETIQTVLLKIIERADAKSVIEVEGVAQS